MTDVLVEHGLMVPMRDGVHLATDVYRPTQGTGHPVLLFRTPYDRSEMARRYGFAEWFANNGYVVVQQDCRGCFGSEGAVDFLRPEAEDGFDTLAWIAAQPWGDVEVGSWGTSWSGWTQTAMAALGASRLKTIVPMMSGSDAYSSSVRQGGALELRWIAWAFWHAAENTQAELGKSAAIEEALIRPEKRFSDWLRQWPIQRGQTQLQHVPAYEKWVFELLEHEDRDEWWQHPSLRPWAYLEQAPFSALWIGSWYDSYTRASFENFAAHQRAGPGRAQLLIGPWTHGTATLEQSFSGDVEFGAEAAIPDYRQLLLDWFDRELKHSDLPAQAPIKLFVMGGGSGKRDTNGRLLHGGRWREEAQWPLARCALQPLYLGEKGTLNGRRPEAAKRVFRYDPADAVPSIGGNVSSLQDVMAEPPAAATYHALAPEQRKQPIVAAGGFDQHTRNALFRIGEALQPLAAREDVLVFETAALQGATEITGPVLVHLWVSSTAPDTDFTARLIDLYPPSQDWPEGFALNIGDSILRLRYRDGSGRARPVAPGTITPITIELYPCANLFAAGHRIRLDISSSNYPRFDRNPNTGKRFGESAQTIVAENTVYLGAEHASHILLPVIPF